MINIKVGREQYMAQSKKNEALIRVQLENAKLKAKMRKLEHRIESLLDIIHLCREHSKLSKDLLSAIEDAINDNE